MAAQNLLNGIAGLSIAIDSLRSTVERYSNENLRQKAISVNTTLIGQINKNSEILNKLPGSIAGNLENAIDAQIAGMRGFDKNIALLATEMRFTNQNSSRMIFALEENRLAIGSSNKQMSELAKSVLESSNRYGIQTGVLVEALENLTPLLEDYTGFEFADPLQKAVVKLQGMVGPAMSKRLNDSIKSLLDPSINGMVSASKLQLQGIRQQIFASKDQDQILKLLIKAIDRGADAQEFFRQSALATGDMGATLGVFQGIFDTRMTQNFDILNRSLKERDKENKERKIFNDTIAKLKDSFEQLTLTGISPLLVTASRFNDGLLKLGNIGNGIIAKLAATSSAVVGLGYLIKRLNTTIKSNTAAENISTTHLISFGKKLPKLSGALAWLMTAAKTFLRVAGIVGAIITIVDIIAGLFGYKGIIGAVTDFFSGDKKIDKLEVNELSTKRDAQDYSSLFDNTKTLVSDIFRDIITDTNEILIEETRLAREQQAEYAEKTLNVLSRNNARVITN